MKTLWQDIRYGLRMLTKRPGFTLIAVLALALGIGANTAIFSVVNSVLLRPLRYSDPERLVQVWETSSKLGRNSIPASFPNFADWRDQNQVFEQMVTYADWTFNLTGAGEPERIQSAVVSPAFFSTLGIKPMLGRSFAADEDQPGKDQVVLIGQGLWQRRFGGDPSIIGKTLDLNGKSFTVVGVVERGAQLPLQSDEIEIWAPVSHGFGLKNRGGHYLSVVGRLKRGITLQQAQAEMDTIARRLSQEYPEANPDRGIRLVSLHEQVVGDLRSSLLVLLGAVVFVLFIASANVANMLLARAMGRQKEIAIRIALGAGRLRLVRQLLTESVLLALVGGGLGVFVALWGVDLLVALSPADLPRVKEVAIDGRVLGFSLAISLLTGVLFGLAPALQGSRPDLNETLKEAGRNSMAGESGRRLRGLLVVGEIALSLVLLIGAGLLIRSFMSLQGVHPGFNPRDVLTMQLDLSGPKYAKEERMLAFHQQLLDRLKTLPGVDAVSTRTFVPLTADFANLTFGIEGQSYGPGERPVAYYNTLSPDYLRTMEIPLLKGRDFTQYDRKEAPGVALVNEIMVRRYFAGVDPLGKRITLSDHPKESDWRTIVGVVGDTRSIRLDGEPGAEIYMPFDQDPEPYMSLMIRTSADPGTVAAAVRNEVAAVEQDQPVFGIRTMDRVIAESVSQPRFRTLLLGLFAAVALLLAAIGIYGVMAYAVSQRTHEIGIRMALGAQPADVLRLVAGQGLLLTLAGVGVGLISAFALTRVMSSLLYGVSPTDPLTFTVISLLLGVAAMLACYVPARRAMKVDPMVALRYE